MSAIFDELSNRALCLPPQERARLADVMVESLDHAALTDIDQAWIALAERRAAEIDSGTAATFAADDVISQARRTIRR